MHDLNTSPVMGRLRRIISMSGPAREPDFFGIGAEKCGTTWLWDMFRDHPEIGVPYPKELRYFAQLYLNTGLNNFNALTSLLQNPTGDKLNARKAETLLTELRISMGSDPAYLRIFGALSGKMVGDVSPQYCMLPHEGIAHMKRVAPSAKIIMMLRDPVSRVISAGKMKAGEEVEELDEATVRRKSLIRFQLNMSRYSAILDRYESLFPGQVFVAFMDDVIERPLDLLEQLCEFLGVDHDPSFYPNLDKRSNEGRSFKASDDLLREVWNELRGEYDSLEQRFPERVSIWRKKYEAFA